MREQILIKRSKAGWQVLRNGKVEADYSSKEDAMRAALRCALDATRSGAHVTTTVVEPALLAA
ncbi:hypothetical protein [Flaviflagellibacter deserti]|jgi:hypothetical protein|uniref:DUF2188 domain-containing protein n=1 Tax=Flaviflagellibacter deserti TaxID=2267266 RepID=A0ABV9YWP5_9HYPH